MEVRFSAYLVLYTLIYLGQCAKGTVVENRSLINGAQSIMTAPHLSRWIRTNSVERGNLQEFRNMQDSRYLRLQLHVDNGTITVANAKKIEGPLLQLEEIHLATGIVYEVRKNDKRLDLGAIPYDALFTSFTDLRRDDARPSDLADIGPYNIHIRIPLTDDFGSKELNDLEIVIYDLQEPFMNMPISKEPIALQFPKKIKKVAHLKCIDVKSLPNDLQEELSGIFKE